MIHHLEPYCAIGATGGQDLQSAFTLDKKQALISYYKATYPWWISAFKVLPLFIIDIRPLNPTGSLPQDILNRAHNLVLLGNIESSLLLLEKLPTHMRQMMMPFMQKARGYVQAKSALANFILSYQNQGV